MKKTFLMLSATLAFGIALPAQAQFSKAEDAVKYRQAAFELMANHMGRLGAMVRGNAPFDAAKAQESARLIESLGRLPWEAFTPHSAVAPSKVKGDPWKDAAEFRQLQDKFSAEAGKLVAAAASLETLRQQLSATGSSCKACHDQFRK